MRPAGRCRGYHARPAAQVRALPPEVRQSARAPGVAVQSREESLSYESAQKQIRAEGDLSLDELMPDRKEMESLSAEGSVNPEAFAIRSEEAALLRVAVQQLPAQYRIVLVLRDMEGLTDEDVAEITGLRAGNVRVRLHRARLFVELMKSRRRGIRKSVSSSHRSPSRGAFPTCRIWDDISLHPYKGLGSHYAVQ